MDDDVVAPATAGQVKRLLFLEREKARLPRNLQHHFFQMMPNTAT